MFDELTKYKNNGHFFFQRKDNLTTVCNAPTDKNGVYYIYALTKGKIKLFYIGHSGELKKDGTIYIHKKGLGGIKDSIINDLQFDLTPRQYAWPFIMKYEDIDALDIYWYVTHDGDNKECPKILANKFLQRHKEIFGKLPVWNRKQK